MIVPIVLATAGLTTALLLTYYFASRARKPSSFVHDDDYDVENYDLVNSRPIYKKPQESQT